MLAFARGFSGCFMGSNSPDLPVLSNHWKHSSHFFLASPGNPPEMGIKMPEMGNATTTGSRPTRRRAADALFTTSRQRVLALLFGQPARSFCASELIERTDSGSGAVQRELKRLASSGLATVKRIGNQKHYQEIAAPRSAQNCTAW